MKTDTILDIELKTTLVYYGVAKFLSIMARPSCFYIQQQLSITVLITLNFVRF